MKASDLPCWTWLLLALVIGAVGIDGLVGFTGKPAQDPVSIAVACLLLALSIVLAVVGVIRFFKWAWRD